MLKAELHAHTSDDPNDRIPHSAVELIDRAAALGYQALAITLHDKQFDVTELAAYARTRHIVLLPGVERTIDGKHVLLINFPAQAERVESFEEIMDLKARCSGVVIAPHPFYPTPSCLKRRLMNRHAALIDAVEFNAMYTRQLDFNRAARAWAATHRKPLVGNSDVHRLSQLGTTYSLIDADPDADAIIAAIRAGRVEIRTRPLAWIEAANVFAKLLTGGGR